MDTSKSEGKRSFKYKMEDEDEEEEDDEFNESGFGEDEKKKRAMSTTSKKGSGSGGSTTLPTCQAENCNADLTEGKHYHKRHKVCEVHAKAPAVRVAGLQQRFCQQCSRFHELSEFDDNKRSCRRRLAGHNERRRKSSSEFQREGSN